MSEAAPLPQHRAEAFFRHVPHPRLAELHHERPVQISDEQVGINGRIALAITAIVGTMVCAYVFTVLALISFPAAISSGNILTIIAWIAQTFLQLVLLPIIIVGQNIQGRASDKRAVQTYKDAEAILSECMQLQAHLEAQDRILDDLVTKMQAIVHPSA